MTIIVFLIDTSASMNQRAYLGGRPTMIDVAKGAVETFVKVRQRSMESRGDRYMLLTFEEPPSNIKAGWKENLQTFMTELKNLQSTSLTSMGAALKQTFDVLNINRMQTGIDTYGQGRCPYYLEPSVIVVITDGGKLSSMQGVQEDFNLPMHAPIPGSELTREPFRWDQRLFALVLRMAGTPSVERDTGLVPSDNSPIDAMCEVTGGRSYCITSHRMLMQCIDSLVQKVQSGVVINFEKIGPDPPPVGNDGIKSDIEMLLDGGDGNEDSLEMLPLPGGVSSRPQTPTTGPQPSLGSLGTAWHTCRRLIYVPRSAQKGFPVGHWPIPESFWPELSASVLPPRTAHPNVKFTCTSQEPLVIENLPFDKYELEPSPLTQYILSRKQPTVCWQVFVSNSYKNSEVGHPFGYLKASTNLSCVNLFIMPYNYPLLLPLLEELFKIHRGKPPPEWRMQFNNYLRTMPAYYAAPLRRALHKIGGPQIATALMPDNMENGLSYSVLNYLKRLKNQAKIEFDRLCNDVGKKSNQTGIIDGIRVQARNQLKKDLVSHPLLQEKFSSLREQVQEFSGFMVATNAPRVLRGQSYRNPFDVARHSLLDQLVRMRANFARPSSNITRSLLHDEDEAHSMPVSQMGNYQEYLKRVPPQLREIESAPVRQHMFGNPFKIDKRMMVDEADEADLVSAGGGGGGGGRGTKRQADSPLASPRTKGRKPGPIPRDVLVRRPSSPMPMAMPPDFPPPSPTATATAPVTPSVVPPAINPPPPQLPPLPTSAADLDPDLIICDTPPLPPILVNGTMLDDHFPRSPSPPLELLNHVDVIRAVPGAITPNHVSEGLTNHLPPPPTPPAAPPPLTAAEKLAIHRHNIAIRSKAYREVRRPGKDISLLLSQLRELKGEVNSRVNFVQDVINESKRFRRQRMADQLERFLETLLQAEGTTVNGQTHR